MLINVANETELQAAISAKKSLIFVTESFDFAKDTSCISVDHNVVIDFGGHKVTSSAKGFDLACSKAGSRLVLCNGTFETASWAVWVQNAGVLTVASDMIVANTQASPDLDKPTIYVGQENSTLNIYGTVTSKYDTAISGNGSVGEDKVIINIFEGANIVAEQQAAIYMPNSKALNIGGATITGNVAGVYIKCGIVNISNSTITATGEAKAYEFCRAA